jgi:multiple sugar transport system ATP-binding protein
VFDNMAFGLKLRKTPKDQIKRRVESAAEILDITHLLDRKPKALSGGQRQRVALGRAIVREPKVFLLDEPLSNLDAKLRAQMRTELSKLHNDLGTTFIYVTHDQTEAMTMGDRIVVMKDGLVQQVDTPQNLYEKPCNSFVAGFMGSPQMNFIDAKLVSRAGAVAVEFGIVNGKAKYCMDIPEGKIKGDSIKAFIGKDVTLGVRPEHLHDDEMFISLAKDGIIEVKVEVTELLGAETFLYLNLEGQSLTARVDPRTTAKMGDTLKIAIDTNKIHLFDKETEQVIMN